MKDGKVKMFKDESGSALILAMMILVSGILIFSSITSVSLLQRSASSKMRSSTEAFQIADSCLEWTLMNYYKFDGADPVSDMGSFAGDVFAPDFLVDNLSGGMLDVGGENYPVGDCKVYLLDEDGTKITSDATLLKDVREVQSVGRAGFGKDVTRRAVQVGLDSCGQDVEYEGVLYPTVKIGTQCWFAKNLNVGNRIDGPIDQTDNSVIEKYCHNNLESECDIYGGFYLWDEAMKYSTIEGTKGICPTDWHIPTDNEWKILEGTVDSVYGIGDPEWNQTGFRGSDVGDNLKQGGSSGFEALMSGYRGDDGLTDHWFGLSTRFWTSSISGSESIRRYLGDSVSTINWTSDFEEHGISIRCIRD